MTITSSIDLKLEHTVLARLSSPQFATKYYHFSRHPFVALVRGALAATGATFGFLSLLSITPDWTSFVYFVGLFPELISLIFLIDIQAHALLWYQFEYLFVAINGFIFSGLMIDALFDFRAVVTLTMSLVVLSCEAQDASIPLEQSKHSSALFSFIGSAACFIVYFFVQFGYVSITNFRIINSGVEINGNTVIFSNVQFACDRLLTAAFFLLKQSIVGYFYPGTFIFLREMIEKKIHLPNQSTQDRAIIETEL